MLSKASSFPRHRPGLGRPSAEPVPVVPAVPRLRGKPLAVAASLLISSTCWR